MPITAKQFDRRPMRPAFTLVELLVVMGVLAMLSSLVLVGLASAAEQARINRTRSQVQKIHELLMTRWEDYRYRRVEASKTGNVRARQGARVDRIRELMRMEMPCHVEDLKFASTLTPASNTTALYERYKRQIDNRAGSFSSWTDDFDDAECLYMIIESIQVGETNGLDFFKPSEIGDVDNDGMPEILDGWGNPIRFLRWAPGFVGARSNLHHADSPDPFDPLNVRGGKSMTGSNYDHFPLYPLIFSSGPDGATDILIRFSTQSVMDGTVKPDGSTYLIPNDPYFASSGRQFGEETDANSNGKDEYLDNITNHQLVIAGNSQ